MFNTVLSLVNPDLRIQWIFKCLRSLIESGDQDPSSILIWCDSHNVCTDIKCYVNGTFPIEFGPRPLRRINRTKILCANTHEVGNGVNLAKAGISNVIFIPTMASDSFVREISPSDVEIGSGNFNTVNSTYKSSRFSTYKTATLLVSRFVRPGIDTDTQLFVPAATEQMCQTYKKIFDLTSKALIRS